MNRDPLIGQQLANFRIERLIGRGGMAGVYYGLDVKLQRPVAIKVIDTRYRNSGPFTQRFLKEARLMAKWRHENIVQIYYADDHEGYYYYVMEYVDGQDLATILALYAEDGELMPLPDVLRIGDAVASALDYAHKQGVIHRDVKPANILIANDNRVLLSDFGLALDTSERSYGEAFGTPLYISPEQARRSNDAIPQSDLYSFAVILFEMLTGVAPFNDPSAASVALQHLTQSPPAPHTINPELNAEVDAVLLKALDKDAHKRFQSGAELMSALKKALAGKSDSVKIPLPPIPVGVPTIRRSSIPLDTMARRRQVKAAPPPAKPAKKNNGMRIFFGLLLIGLLLFVFGWLTGLGAFTEGPAPTRPVIVIGPSATLAGPAPVTATEEPLPTLTAIPASPAAAHTESPAPSVTSVPPTITPVPFSPTLSTAPTVKYPDGNHFTVFYNVSSFYLLNRSTVIRSASGFSFERLNNNGATQNLFEGWRWEEYFGDSQPGRCLRIEIWEAETPYLQPLECNNRFLSTLQPADYSPLIFWTPKTDSTQFRVLWMDEEVARCEISAGVCDFYVP